MDKFEIILTDCIKEIKSGKASLNDCLDRYPSLREELEPLLRVALNLQQPRISNMDSDYKQAMKARLLQQIRSTGQKKAWSLVDVLSLGVPARLAWARIAVSVIAIVIVLSLLAGGTAYASQNSLPGDLLYPVKIAAEDARLIIAGDNSDRAILNLRFAETRLEELGRLISSDEDKTGIALNGYRRNLEKAREQIQVISNTPDLLQRSFAQLQEQMAYCDNIIDMNPGYPEQVREAGSLNINTQIEFLKMLQRQNTLQAAQLNLNAMQNRLHRAQEKANESRFQAMEEALLQYGQFNNLGEEILEYARNADSHDAEIEEMSIPELSNFLDTLDSIARGVPQEHRNAIEESRQQTLHHESRVRGQGPQREEPGRNSGQESPGNTGGDGRGQSKSPQNEGANNNVDDETQDTATSPSSIPGEKTKLGNRTSPGEDTGPDTGSQIIPDDIHAQSQANENDNNLKPGNSPDSPPGQSNTPGTS